MIESTQKNKDHPYRDLERMSYMLRANLLFDNHDHVSMVTGNACGEGLFCLHGSRLSEHHVGEEGTGRIEIGPSAEFNVAGAVMVGGTGGGEIELDGGKILGTGSLEIEFDADS